MASAGLNPAHARDEWYRGLDLEAAAGSADLVLIVRVADVSESKVVFGGKAERVAQQFQFEPLRTLKGVFARDVLSLTTDDLRAYGDGRSQLERGQVRLLLLGRSGYGYQNVNQAGDLDRSVPPLRDEKDPLGDTVRVLIAVSQQHDRQQKVALLADGLRTARGPAAVPLLLALERRALLAAQVAGAAAAVTRHLNAAEAPVREAAAQALTALLERDYLGRPLVDRAGLALLTAAVRQRQGDLAARLAALRAVGQLGDAALKDDAVARQFRLDAPRQTLMERSVVLNVIGRRRWAARRDAVATFVEQLPPDAPADLQQTAGWALARLDPARAAGQFAERLRAKYDAGLEVRTELALLAELPADRALPALLAAAKLSLNADEKQMFAAAAYQRPDPRLVPALADLLDVRRPQVRGPAIDALFKIDTDEAARALRPHLREEAALPRKLQLAEFLGRHGIRDGYPYAMEHCSEPELLEQAVAALAALRDPRAVPALGQILKTSHDLRWEAAAVRGLGALGDREVVPQLLDVVKDFRQPLTPAALIALGDLGEARALPSVRDGLASRNDRVVIASARAAGKLVPAAGAKAAQVRARLAALLADADATPEVRAAALDALLAIKDPAIGPALQAAARDAGLEGTGLLARVEELLRDRKIALVQR